LLHKGECGKVSHDQRSQVTVTTHMMSHEVVVAET